MGWAVGLGMICSELTDLAFALTTDRILPELLFFRNHVLEIMFRTKIWLQAALAKLRAI
jgi:hypothetical protein